MEEKLETGEYIYILAHRGRPLIKKNFSIIKTSFFFLSRFLSRTYFYFMRFHFFFFFFIFYGGGRPENYHPPVPQKTSRPERGNFPEKNARSSSRCQAVCQQQSAFVFPPTLPISIGPSCCLYILTGSFCSSFFFLTPHN